MSIHQIKETKKYTILLESGAEDACFLLRSMTESDEIPFHKLTGKYKVLNVFNTLLEEENGRLIVPFNKLKKVRQYLAMFSNGLLGNLVEIRVPAEIEKVILQAENIKTKRYLNTGDGLAEITLDDGCMGETVPIPVRSESFTAARPIKLENEYVTLKDLGYRVRRGVSNSTNDFIREAENLAGYNGEKTDRIPFSCYYPTYEAMTPNQQKWYFWWRSCVRRKEYPETDLSYIFIHIYELINQVGIKDARDGYNRLADLWHHYRNTYPKLDNYMSVWIHDYIHIYSCEFNESDAAELLCNMSNISIDWIIRFFSDEPFEHVPLTLFLYLNDFPLQNSRFYCNGSCEELEKLFCNVLAKVDVFLQAAHGKSILTYFCPGDGYETKRLPFPGAIYVNSENKTISVSVKPYSTYQPLRDFITAIMKLAENKLREIRKIKGRLKAVEMEPDLLQFINVQLAAAVKRQEAEANKVTISVDLDRVSNLIQDSDWVRDRLLEGNTEIFAEMKLNPVIPGVQPVSSVYEQSIGSVSVQEVKNIKLIDEKSLASLPEEWNEFLLALEDYQIDALRIIYKTGYEAGKESLEKICEQYLVLPQMLIDMINNAAMDTLGDLLIDTVFEEPVIFDEYKDVLRKLFRD